MVKRGKSGTILRESWDTPVVCQRENLWSGSKLER